MHAASAGARPDLLGLAARYGTFLLWTTDGHRFTQMLARRREGRLACGAQSAPGYACLACHGQARVCCARGLGSKRAWTRPPSCTRAGCLGSLKTIQDPWGGDVCGSPTQAIWLPSQAGRQWARRGLRSSWLEEQAPNDAHPGRQRLPGTRSVSTTGEPTHKRPSLPIRRQPSVSICVNLWFTIAFLPMHPVSTCRLTTPPV